MAPTKTTVNCAKCIKGIGNNSYSISCDACKGWFHRDCSNLTLAEIKLKLENQDGGKTNWMCSSCVTPTTTTPFRSSSTFTPIRASVQNNFTDLQKEIALLNLIITEKDMSFKLIHDNKSLLEELVVSLKQEIAELKLKLANSADSLVEVVNTTNNTEAVSCINQNVTKCNELQSIETQVICLGPTNMPLNYQNDCQKLRKSTTELSTSTNNNNSRISHIIGNGMEVQGLTASKPKKWFFVSRINKDVTDDTFKSYIKDTLKIQDAVCTQIVSNKYSIEASNYLSYKIGVSDKDCSTIMSPTSWPSGLLIKEFKFKLRTQQRKYNNFDKSNKSFNYFRKRQASHQTK